MYWTYTIEHLQTCTYTRFKRPQTHRYTKCLPEWLETIGFGQRCQSIWEYLDLIERTMHSNSFWLNSHTIWNIEIRRLLVWSCPSLILKIGKLNTFRLTIEQNCWNTLENNSFEIVSIATWTLLVVSKCVSNLNVANVNCHFVKMDSTTNFPAMISLGLVFSYFLIL